MAAPDASPLIDARSTLEDTIQRVASQTRLFGCAAAWTGSPRGLLLVALEGV